MRCVSILSDALPIPCAHRPANFLVRRELPVLLELFDDPNRLGQRRLRSASATPGEAAVTAARNRLRPILMTSLAFIFGVAPLVVATGAGSEMPQSLGTAVFAGMLGVTAFGLLFTPAFYAVVRKRPKAEANKAVPATYANRDNHASGARRPSRII
jgi:hypothetical protein